MIDHVLEKNRSRQRLNLCHVIPELHVDWMELGSKSVPHELLAYNRGRKKKREHARY